MSMTTDAIDDAREQGRIEARAARDVQWLAALAKEWTQRPSAMTCEPIENIAERMGLGEQFAALLRERKGKT